MVRIGILRVIHCLDLQEKRDPRRGVRFSDRVAGLIGVDVAMRSPASITRNALAKHPWAHLFVHETCYLSMANYGCVKFPDELAPRAFRSNTSISTFQYNIS